MSRPRNAGLTPAAAPELFILCNKQSRAKWGETLLNRRGGPPRGQGCPSSGHSRRQPCRPWGGRVSSWGGGVGACRGRGEFSATVPTASQFGVPPPHLGPQVPCHVGPLSHSPGPQQTSCGPQPTRICATSAQPSRVRLLVQTALSQPAGPVTGHCLAPWCLQCSCELAVPLGSLFTPHPESLPSCPSSL